MTRFVLRRLGSALLLLFLVLTGTFFLIHIAPGDPFAVLFADPRIPAHQLDRMREHYGLDQPLGVQYLQWLRSMTSGDWGTSLVANRPVAQVLGERIPNTALLIGGALLVEHLFGLTFGLWAASRAGGWIDHLIRGTAVLLYALPLFWLAPVAIELLAVRWPLFPAAQLRSAGPALTAFGRLADVLHHLVLPAFVLGLGRCGAVVRFVRNGLLEVMRQDYIRTARAIGLPPRRILWVHALRNALGPVVQRLGLSLSLLLSGALIIEVIFAWPGLGQILFTSILSRDYPVILAATALSGVAVVLGNLVADLLQAWIDPRVRDA